MDPSSAGADNLRASGAGVGRSFFGGTYI
ncbi:MAG: hypothetical protein JWP15_2009, partial [Alphaproteobacteria bacterium]|nr:hypothetical protein [Alphaproteobacteria bacterium]